MENLENKGKLRRNPLKFDVNGKIVLKQVVYKKKGKERTLFRVA
jgi:hypothetical protein